MLNGLNRCFPTLLAITMLAGPGYLGLTRQQSAASDRAAEEIVPHADPCLLCQLPLYGNDSVSSKFGLTARSPAQAESHDLSTQPGQTASQLDRHSAHASCALPEYSEDQ